MFLICFYLICLYSQTHVLITDFYIKLFHKHTESESQTNFLFTIYAHYIRYRTLPRTLSSAQNQQNPNTTQKKSLLTRNYLHLISLLNSFLYIIKRFTFSHLVKKFRNDFGINIMNSTLRYKGLNCSFPCC